MLRDFAGIAPSFPEVLRERRPASSAAVAERWERRPHLSRGSPAWLYLTEQRRLPESILLAARAADAVREGPHGSAWFAHRDAAGVLTGIEMRGPDYRNFSAGGGKTLFRLPGGTGPLSRVAVCEGAIDALSLAAIERCRADTLYAATAGGMGPETVVALQQLLRDLADDPAGVLIAATDADIAGRRHAARLEDSRGRGRGAVRDDPAARRAERLERCLACDDAGARSRLAFPLPCPSLPSPDENSGSNGRKRNREKQRGEMETTNLK